MYENYGFLYLPYTLSLPTDTISYFLFDVSGPSNIFTVINSTYVQIPAFTTGGNIVLNITHDMIHQSTSSPIITLRVQITSTSGITNGNILSVLVQITDIDPTPQVLITSTTTILQEASGYPFIFTVALSGMTADPVLATVDFSGNTPQPIASVYFLFAPLQTSINKYITVRRAHTHPRTHTHYIHSYMTYVTNTTSIASVHFIFALQTVIGNTLR